MGLYVTAGRGGGEDVCEGGCGGEGVRVVSGAIEGCMRVCVRGMRWGDESEGAFFFLGWWWLDITSMQLSSL